MGKFFKIILVIFVVFLLISILGGINKLVSSADEDDIKSANIGVIEVKGVITDSFPVLEQIREFKKNSQLKALVVRINSPGGAVGASQEIFMELKKLRPTYPVIVSMGDLAASGGLYVSLGGETVFALPGTLTGSMGVLLELTNFARLLDKIYIDSVTIRTGDLKDAGNPTRPLDPKAKKYFETLIQQTFNSFKESVKTERKVSAETIQLLSDGRVVDGNEALKLGLVDKIGTFQDAVSFAKEKAKISGDPKLTFLSRKPKGLFERVLEGAVAPIHDLVKESSSVLQYKWSPFGH
ncbi:MAG: signal peptide peptidase SppA [Deltaproteobacteria bacterium]|nr:signal peptide peptidase SppA [Deltaproteobacteria bacterium]